MDELNARIVVACGALVAVAVWLMGIRCHQTMRQVSAHISQNTILRRLNREEAMRRLLTMVATHYAILDRTDDRVVVQMPFATVAVKFNARGEDTELTTAAQLGAGARIFSIVMTGLVYVLAPLVIFGLFWILWNYAAPNPDPTFRWQSIQILQVVHVLWPPFLIAHLHGKFVKAMQTFVNNLPILLEVANARTPTPT